MRGYRSSDIGRQTQTDKQIHRGRQIYTEREDTPKTKDRDRQTHRAQNQGQIKRTDAFEG